MASNGNTVTIYDTPSKDGETWSHHVLRILYSLHYKGISYTIEGIEYPDIVSTFASTTLEPKNDPIEPYEIPVVKIHAVSGDPQYYMDTVSIINALEDLQPEHPLLYTTPRSVEYRSRFGPTFAPIIQLAVGHVPSVLSDRSVENFVQKRKSRWGKSVEQWVEEHPIEKGLAIAEPRLKEFGDWLELTAGPFINGDKPGYADFTVASFLGFVKAVGLIEAFDAILGVHPAVRRLYEGVKSTQLGNFRCQGLFET